MTLLKRLFSKRITLALLLVIALAALLTTTQTWIVIQLDENAAVVHEFELSGNTLAPLAAALSLAAAAGVTALTIANRSLRFVILAVEILAGIGIAWSAVVVAGDPLAAAVPHLAEGTGLIGLATFEQHLDSLQARVWMMSTALLGMLLAIVSLFGLIVSTGWAGSGSRYQRKASSLQKGGSNTRVGSTPLEDSAPADRIDDWDAISEGKDPSEE